MLDSWQARGFLLDLWKEQGQRLTPPPYSMPVWAERDGRQYTLCATCKTLLHLTDAPLCGGCAARRAAVKRASRKARKRAALRTRLGQVTR